MAPCSGFSSKGWGGAGKPYNGRSFFKLVDTSAALRLRPLGPIESAQHSRIQRST